MLATEMPSKDRQRVGRAMGCLAEDKHGGAKEYRYMAQDEHGDGKA